MTRTLPTPTTTTTTTTPLSKTGPIRSLALVPTLGGFMSTSNDGTVRVWSDSGDGLVVLRLPIGRDGQPTFIFDGCPVEEGSQGGVRLVSGGEDGSACIWEGQVRSGGRKRRCSGSSSSSSSTDVLPAYDDPPLPPTTTTTTTTTRV